MAVSKRARERPELGTKQCNRARVGKVVDSHIHALQTSASLHRSLAQGPVPRLNKWSETPGDTE